MFRDPDKLLLKTSACHKVVCREFVACSIAVCYNIMLTLLRRAAFAHGFVEVNPYEAIPRSKLLIGEVGLTCSMIGK
jgi:hypothetical protein